MSYNTPSANNSVVNEWLKTPQGEFTLSFIKHVEYELKKNKFTIVDRYQMYEDTVHVLYTMFNKSSKYQEQIL